jgi:hypothetical protein
VATDFFPGGLRPAEVFPRRDYRDDSPASAAKTSAAAPGELSPAGEAREGRSGSGLKNLRHGYSAGYSVEQRYLAPRRRANFVAFEKLRRIGSTGVPPVAQVRRARRPALPDLFLISKWGGRPMND